MGQTRLIDVFAGKCAQLKVSQKPSRTVGDIMQTNVRTLTLDDNVRKTLDVMKANKIRHIPVIDYPTEDGRKPFFVGIASQRDVLRLKQLHRNQGGGDDIDPKALRQLLGQVITRKPKITSPDAPITDVVSMMIENRIDMIPALSEEELVGIVTTTDIIKLLIKFGDVIHEILATSQNRESIEDSCELSLLSSFTSKTVDDIMTRNVICMEEKDTLIKAIDLLKKARFRHVVITDQSGNITGIASDRDILRQLPFAGPRPPKASKKFRADLFRLSPKMRNLNLTMQDIMTSNIKNVSTDSSIFDVAHTINRLRIGCLPVIEERTIRGIVTTTDLLQTVLGIYETTDEASSVRQKANAQ